MSQSFQGASGSPIPEFIYPGGTCPICLRDMQANLHDDKFCPSCRYSRPRPAPETAKLGIAGTARYGDVKDRLLKLIANINVGDISNLMGCNLGEPLALDLRCDVTNFTGGWELNVRDCTHVISVGRTPAIEAANKLGKPIRLISAMPRPVNPPKTSPP